MSKDLIDLQHAHVTQITEGGTKGPWMVRQNMTSEDLWELPAHMKDADVFAIMAFARHFELVALNAGIQFQKGHQDARLLADNQQLEAKLQAMQHHNDRLAEVVERLTRQEQEV